MLAVDALTCQNVHSCHDYRVATLSILLQMAAEFKIGRAILTFLSKRNYAGSNYTPEEKKTIIPLTILY